MAFDNGVNSLAASVTASGTSLVSKSDALREGFPAYFHVGFLSVMIWDALHNVRDDYDLLFSYEVKMNTVVYFISRIVTLIYALGKVIFLTVPLDDCTSLQSALSGMYVAIVVSTLLLALFRIRSIFRTNAMVVVLLGISLAVVVGASLTFVTGVNGKQVPGSPYCVDDIEGQYVGAALVTVFANHAFLLSATTIFVWKNNVAEAENLSRLEQFRKFVDGNTSSASSRYLLQDQLCFIVTTIVSGISMIWFFAFSSDHGSLQITIVVAYCVIANIMVSRVYRNTTLRPAAEEIATAVSSKFSMSGMTTPHHFAVAGQDHLHEVRYVTSGSDSGCDPELKANPLEIEVSKVVESKRDTVVAAEPSEDQVNVFHVKMV